MPCYSPVVTVFLGDRRCAPTAAMPLVCRRRGCHSRRDSTYRRLKLRWINNLVVWLGWPVCTSNAYKLANRVTHPAFPPQTHLHQQQSHPPVEKHPMPPEWETLHDANQPPFYVNHATRRSTFERPIPVSVLWQL